jgi:hypothetical protein
MFLFRDSEEKPWISKEEMNNNNMEIFGGQKRP